LSKEEEGKMGTGLLFWSIFGLFAGIAFSQSVNPVGKWTDSRYPTSGGFFFICKKTTYVTVYTGVYSQIGYVKGKFVNNIFSGRWYEPGLGRNVNGQFLPTSGNFWLNFTSNTNFKGYYMYDEDVNSTKYDWSGSQLNTNKPDPIKCWDNTNAPPTIRNAGEWNFMGSSLVLNEDPLIGEKVWFNASHFYTLPGYFEGWCNDTDQICRGQFLQENYYGQVLFGIGRANGAAVLYTTIFAGSWDEITMNIGLQFTDPTQHIYTSSPQISESVDPDMAAQYQVILLQGNFVNTGEVSFNPTESFDYNNTNSSYLSAGTNVGLGQNVYSYYREYSVLRGTYDWMSRTLTGEYYAPGLTFSDGSPTFGVYTLSVSWDWISAVGTFTPNSVSRTVYDTADWNFTRATWFRVSDDESLFNYANVSNISGHYIGEAVMTDWKVCVDSTNWLNGSITMNGTQLIYNSAYCSSIYQVCSGADTTGDRTNGYTFAYRTDSGVEVDYFATRSTLPNSSEKQTMNLVKQMDVPTASDCWANNYLVLVGTWNDTVYGEKLYINYLATPSVLFGAYSEVGVLRGNYNASSRQWIGRWAEAGQNYGSPTALPSGPFTVSWSNIFSFTSAFSFDQRLTNNPDVILYDEYVASDPVPTVEQCWSNDAKPSITVSGVYGDSSIPKVLYLCLADSSNFPQFTASYNWPDGTKGYVEGTCDLINDVCRGTFFQNKGLRFVNSTPIIHFYFEREHVWTGYLHNHLWRRYSKYSNLFGLTLQWLVECTNDSITI
jgi:hypothetical protein